MYVYVFLIIFFLAILWILKQTWDSKGKLPPGPMRWPLLGSFPQMLMEDLRHPHLQLAGLAKKHGPLMSFGFGVHYAVVITKYEIFKDLLTRTETNMERMRFEFLEQRNNNQNLGIIWSYGEIWKQQRRFTMRLLRDFGFGKKNSMDETIRMEVDELVGEIHNEIKSSGGIWEVDMKRISACILNLLWASVGGYRFDPHSSTIKRQLDISYKIFESLGAKNLLSAFPFLKVFPVMSGFRRHYELHQDARAFTSELIEDAKKRRCGRVEPESFIEVYLDEIEKNRSNPNTIITEDQLVLTLMDLFLGGSDGTPSAISWIILYLGLYDDVQKKVQAEIFDFLQRNPSPIPSVAMAKMPYTNAVILEILRHAPFIGLTLPRKVTQDIECEGYKIPKGTVMFANIYAMLHDETVWGDPEKFRPERLILSDGTLDKEKVQRIHQFGIGARACPGENMAMVAMFMMMIGLLQNFTLEVVKGREPTIEPEEPSLTMKPKQFPLKVKILNI